jgi:hypothetical protein
MATTLGDPFVYGPTVGHRSHIVAKHPRQRGTTILARGFTPRDMLALPRRSRLSIQAPALDDPEVTVAGTR